MNDCDIGEGIAELAGSDDEFSTVADFDPEGMGIGGTGGTSTTPFRLSEPLLVDGRLRRLIDGECRIELKKPLPLAALGVDATVGEELAMSALLEGTGISTDSDGCGCNMGCGDEVAKGEVNMGGEGEGEVPS